MPVPRSPGTHAHVVVQGHRAHVGAVRAHRAQGVAMRRREEHHLALPPGRGAAGPDGADEETVSLAFAESAVGRLFTLACGISLLATASFA